MSLEQQRSKPSKRFDLNDLSNTVLFLAVFVGIWQLVYLLGVWPDFLFPSPIDTLARFAKLVGDGSLALGVGTTLTRLVAGFGIAVTIGITLGLAMAVFRGFGRTMSSFNVGLLSFPSIAWVPFAILLIGFNDYGILFVVIMASVFSMAMSTYGGIRNIPPIYMKAGQNMGAKGISLFRNVMLPAAMPALIAGVRQTWSFAWHAVVGAEMLMTIVGLGAILMFGREFQRMDQVIVSMLMIFVIGLLTDRLLFSKLEEKVRLRWGLR
jgi:NitT/TauT family transport system permease protein